MTREERTEVLVVGAGPVGMLTALLLARGGVQVRIIDREWRTATRTYACALHPSTLRLLGTLGLTRDVLLAGREVSRVAFYEGQARRAEADLSRVTTDCPSVLVLAQSAFEEMLEQKLKAEGRIHVEWNHQLSGLQTDARGVLATIDKMGVSAKGYIIPEMEWSVEKTHAVRADYVVGADGPNSFVAQSLAAGYEVFGQSEFYAVYEIQSDWEVQDELRVVLEKGVTSVLWPLPGKKFRWSLQLTEEHLQEFPAKERTSTIIDAPAYDQANRKFLQKLLQQRAPWFTGKIEELGWATDVEFQGRLARRFGQQYCWLAGDAAHQTGPAGMQSMNRGLAEAQQLAGTLIRILRDKAATETLETYNQGCRDEWRRLLGADGTLKPRPKADPWVQERSTRILACMPASGEDLRQLLGQLQVDLG